MHEMTYIVILSGAGAALVSGMILMALWIWQSVSLVLGSGKEGSMPKQNSMLAKNEGNRLLSLKRAVLQYFRK